MRKQITESRGEDQKLAELILYIATLSEGDPRFGAVKLNKLLFFADFQAYLRFGKPITGQEYQKLEFGPAPRRLPPVLEELKRAGDVAVRVHDYYGHNQQRVFALREADLSLFTAAEVDLVCRL